MGCYVGIENNEGWLRENHNGWYRGIKKFPQWESFPEGFLPVVLVDNGLFKAAGIAYDKREYEVFIDKNDTRPKEVFSVALEKLKKVSDIERWMRDDDAKE